MNKIQIFAKFIFYFVSYICFFWMTSNIIFNHQYVNPDSLGGDFVITSYFDPFLLMIIVCLIICVIYGLQKIELSRKSERIVHLGLFTGIVCLQLILMRYLMFKDISGLYDLSQIMEATNKILHGEIVSSEYFMNTPYQLGPVFLFVIWNKLMFTLGSQSLVFNNVILNIISIDLALVGGYFVVLNLWKDIKKARVYLFLTCVFAPYYAFITYYYTDTLSLPYSIWSIYMYLRLKEKYHKANIYIYRTILLCCLLSIGFTIKATVGIVLIGIIVVELLRNFKVKSIIWLGCVILIFITMNKIPSFTSEKLKWFSYEISEEKGYPIELWLLMGTNEQRLGAYPPNDVITFISQESREDQKRVAREIIAERLKEYKTGGYIKFITNKNNWMWGDGRYFSSQKLQYAKENEIRNFFTKNGIGNPAYAYFSQALQIIILIMMSLSYRQGMKKKVFEDIFLVELCVFGTLLFFSLWESRPRYILNMTPLFLVLAVNGLNTVFKKLDEMPVVSCNYLVKTKK